MSANSCHCNHCCSFNSLVYQVCINKAHREHIPAIRARVDASLRILIDRLLLAVLVGDDGFNFPSTAPQPLRLAALVRCIRVLHVCLHTCGAALRYVEQYAVRAAAQPPLRECAFRYFMQRLHSATSANASVSSACSTSAATSASAASATPNDAASAQLHDITTRIATLWSCVQLDIECVARQCAHAQAGTS